MSGFDYGNARLRARRTRLLERADYELLLDGDDLDRLTGALAAGTHRTAIEEAMPRFSGLRRLDVAIDRHLGEELRRVRSFYGPPVSDRLDLVLLRWDVRNLVAAIRAVAGGGRGAAVSRVVPVGTLGRAVLEELASQPDVRSLLDRVIAWRVPTPALAAVVARAVPDYDRTGDASTVETALQRGFADLVTATVGSAPTDALGRQLVGELDRIDLLTAVRLRDARLAGEPPTDPAVHWVRAGHPGVSGLEALVATDDRQEAVAALGPLPDGFGDAMAAWVVHGSAVTLADDFDRALLRAAAAGFVADPLGIGVPVGYLWAVEAEARDLRLVARAIAHRLDRHQVIDRLVSA